jgi:hypothetical protein
MGHIVRARNLDEGFAGLATGDGFLSLRQLRLGPVADAKRPLVLIGDIPLSPWAVDSASSGIAHADSVNSVETCAACCASGGDHLFPLGRDRLSLCR